MATTATHRDTSDPAADYIGPGGLVAVSTCHPTQILSVDARGACIQVGDRAVDVSWDALADAAAQRDRDLARIYQALHDHARAMRNAQAVAWRILMCVDGDGERVGTTYQIRSYSAEAAQRAYENWRAMYRRTRVYGYRVELLWPEDLEREDRARQNAMRLWREIDHLGAELLREARR